MIQKEKNDNAPIHVQKPASPRVLHFVPGFRYGGVESLLMAIYEKIDKSQLQFDFMIDSIEPNPTIDQIKSLGGRVFQMGRFMSSPLNWTRKMNAIFRKHGSEYIALHSHDVLRSLPVLLASQRHGIKTRILHSHTDSLQGSPTALVAPIITFLTRPLATEYWSCSAAAAKFFFGNRSTRVLKNVIDVQRFNFDPLARSQIRKSLEIEQSAFVIGHTGRFTFQKNHKKIIEIFKKFKVQIKNAHLILVGEGPLEKEIKDLAQSLQLSDAVHFIGKKDLVEPYLSAMDLFLLPSYFEGFCISLLEAQANGLPCLASDVIHSEVMLTPDLQTLSLSATAQQWSEKITTLLQRGRGNSPNNIEIIKQASFSNDFQTSEVLKWYMKV